MQNFASKYVSDHIVYIVAYNVVHCMNYLPVLHLLLTPDINRRLHVIELLTMMAQDGNSDWLTSVFGIWLHVNNIFACCWLTFAYLIREAFVSDAFTFFAICIALYVCMLMEHIWIFPPFDVAGFKDTFHKEYIKTKMHCNSHPCKAHFKHSVHNCSFRDFLILLS